MTAAMLATLGLGGNALADQIVTQSVGNSTPVATMPADVAPESNYAATETPAPEYNAAETPDVVESADVVTPEVAAPDYTAAETPDVTEVTGSDASAPADVRPDLADVLSESTEVVGPEGTAVTPDPVVPAVAVPYLLSGRAAVGLSKLEECTPGAAYKGFVVSPTNPTVLEEVDFVCPTPVVRKAVKGCKDSCIDYSLLGILGINKSDYKSGACSRGSRCVDASRADGLVVRVELLDGRVTNLEEAMGRTTTVLDGIADENITMSTAITYLTTIVEGLQSQPKLSELAMFGAEVRAGECKDEFEHLEKLEGNYHNALSEVRRAQEIMFGLRDGIQGYLGGEELVGEKLDLDGTPLRGSLALIQGGLNKVDLSNINDATLTGMVESYRQAQRSVTAAAGRAAIAINVAEQYRTELLKKGTCKDDHTRVEIDVGANVALYTGDVSAGGEIVLDVLAYPDNGKVGVGGSLIIPTGQGPTSGSEYNERVGAMERSVVEHNQVLPRAIPGVKAAAYVADRLRVYASLGMSIFQNEHSRRSDVNGDVKTINETTTGVGLDARGGIDYKIPLGDKAGLRINAEGGYDTGFGGVFTGGARITW